jgi:L-ascorbate metabolism protein UlaG (beta-lactamase superfamily)
MIYYSGDTGLMNDMKLFGEIYKIDYAILPIGGNFTMDADQAMICSDFIKCNKIIGVHYNTFPLLKINEQEAVKKFSSKGKTLVLLTIGAQMDLE